MRDDTRIGIIGTGLIGGSLALALKQANHAGELIAYDPAVSADLLKGRFVDRVSDSPATLAAQCDVVVLATPVGTSLALLDEIAAACFSKTVLTDVGSTKRMFVDTARQMIDRNGGALSLVPGHPVAGSEKSGIDAARADLFQGCRVVLTPLPETDKQSIDSVISIWEKVGSRVMQMDAVTHDALFAITSHLPHAVAFALIASVLDCDYPEEVLVYSAGGLRDFARVAGSDPIMWRDICLSNRDNLLEAIEKFEVSLDSLRAMVADEDGDALTDFFKRSNDYRRRMDIKNQTG